MTDAVESATGGEVVCLGETMIAFVPDDRPGAFAASAAGAESNVAIGLARLGVPARWVSRLGDDPPGRLVADEVAAAGVAVDLVVDPLRPTGVLVRMPDHGEVRTSYHRRDSAASALGPDDVDRIGSPAWAHVTGITAALSPGAHRLVADVLERRGPGASVVSFDVNLRPALWPDLATAADVLTALARGADVVLVGDDEAELLYGSADPAVLAERFGITGSRELVLKQGDGGAVVVDGAGGTCHERALTVPVVAEAGAGDAFAAGYIAGSLARWPVSARLRLGHVMGARAVGVRRDHVPPFTPEDRRRLTPEGLAERFAAG